MTPSEARLQLLLALGDDEFVLGQRDSEWTGIAPSVEEDVAFSSIAQDEIGHALALYTLAGQLLGRDASAVAFDRSPDSFRHARLLEAPRGDYAFTITRRFVYELADRQRLGALVDSGWQPLAELARKMVVEELLHFDHAALWLRRLSAREPGRSRVASALDAVLPAASRLLAPLPVDQELVSEGVMTRSWRDLFADWKVELRRELDQIGFADRVGEPNVAADGGEDSDRYTPASPTFQVMHQEMLEVRLLAQEGRW